MEDSKSSQQMKQKLKQPEQVQEKSAHHNFFDTPTFSDAENHSRLARGWATEESYEVKIPKATAPEGKVKRNPQSKLCNKANKISSNIIGTELYEKNKRAELIADFQTKCEKQKQEALFFASPENSNFIPEGEEEDLENFYDIRKEQFGEIGRKMAGTDAEHEDGIKECIEKFLQLNIQKLDLSTDEAFVANLSRLDKIARMTDGVTGLIDKNPDVLKKFESRVRSRVMERLQFTQVLTEYYHIRISVITDPLYKSQKNSELVRDGSECTAQERALAIKLQRLDQFTTFRDGKLNKAEDISFVNHVLSERLKMQERPFTEFDTYLEQQGCIKRVEYDNSNGYCVAGQKKKAALPLEGLLRCCTISVAGRNTDLEEQLTMERNLSRMPENQSPAAACKAAFFNEQGLRQAKSIFSHQAEYLCHKYGTWLEYATPQEITEHKEAIMRDFANIREMTEFVHYMKNFPGIFHKKSKQDQRVDDLLNYYLTTIQSVYYKICFKNSFKVSSARNISQLRTARRVTGKVLERNEKILHISVPISAGRNQKALNISPLLEAPRLTRGMLNTVDWKLAYSHDYRSEQELVDQFDLNQRGASVSGPYSHLSKENTDDIGRNVRIFGLMLKDRRFLRLSQLERGDMGEGLMCNAGGEFFGWQDSFSLRNMSLLIFRLAGGLGDQGKKIGVFNVQGVNRPMEMCGAEAVRTYFDKEGQMETQRKDKSDLGVTPEMYEAACSNYEQFQQSELGQLSVVSQETGLRDIRKMLCSKYKFMKQKYGTGLMRLTLGDILIHWSEIFADLSNGQPEFSLIEKYPDLFDGEDAEYRELYQNLSYYYGICFSLKLKLDSLIRNSSPVDFRITLNDLLVTRMIDDAAEMETHPQNEVKWGMQYKQDFEFTPLTKEEQPAFRAMNRVLKESRDSEKKPKRKIGYLPR